MRRSLSPLLLLPLACAAPAARRAQDDWPLRDAAPPIGVLVTGMLGLGELEATRFELDPALGDVDDLDDDASLPTIGAAIVKPLVGRRLRLGIEGGGTIGWDGEIRTVVVTNGGAFLDADNDLVVADLFVGAAADLLLGERLRLYAGAGPLLQFASIEADWDDPLQGPVRLDEDGFGGGTYARAGLEIELDSGLCLGLGVRFVNSSVDLGSAIDEVDLEEVQFLLTATRAM